MEFIKKLLFEKPYEFPDRWEIDKWFEQFKKK